MLSIAVFPIILIIAAIIPIIIGIYVYRDAKQRSMNVALWTLVAIFAPALIGFIIYLLVRGSYSDIKCPQCKTSIKEEYVICPKCGAKLRPSCLSCAAPVEYDWKHCPKCTQPLPEHYENISVPQRTEDKSLRKILAAVIIISILLIVMLIFMFSSVTRGGGSAAMCEKTIDEFYSVQGNTEVQEWIDSLDDDESKAYIMQYTQSDFFETYEYYYVLYVPCAGSSENVDDFGIVNGGLFYDVLKVGFNSGTPCEDTVFCISAESEKKLETEIYCGGVKLECEVVEVDFNPTEGLID
ncbi:MAG: zinc ribbon domain-containing protein [Clostridia bacterium]|nr:zinc ribbon domain-containing protein [Clostridia bacterium]